MNHCELLCNTGYDLIGVKDIYCRDREWTEIPYCEMKTCEDLQKMFLAIGRFTILNQELLIFAQLKVECAH
jgi:hypothetical protein